MSKFSHSTQPPPPPFIQPGHGGLIKNPTASDVLCGRGGRINSHRGNIRFRDIVGKSKHEYLAKDTSKLVKAHIAASVVTQIRNLHPPGRFLKIDPTSGDWIDIGDDKARKKAGQALREDAKEVRKEIEKEGEETRSKQSCEITNSSSGTLDNDNINVQTHSGSHASTENNIISSPTMVSYSGDSSHFEAGASYSRPHREEFSENVSPGPSYSPVHVVSSGSYSTSKSRNDVGPMLPYNYNIRENNVVSQSPSTMPLLGRMSRETSDKSEMDALILDSLYDMDNDASSKGSIEMDDEIGESFREDNMNIRNDYLRDSWLQQEDNRMRLHNSHTSHETGDPFFTSTHSINSKMKENNSLYSGEEMSWAERSNQNMAYWSSQTVSSWKDMVNSWSSNSKGPPTQHIVTEKRQTRRPSTSRGVDNNGEQSDGFHPRRNMRDEWRKQMMNVQSFRNRKNEQLEKQITHDLTDESETDGTKFMDRERRTVMERKKPDFTGSSISSKASRSGSLTGSLLFNNRFFKSLRRNSSTKINSKTTQQQTTRSYEGQNGRRSSHIEKKSQPRDFFSAKSKCITLVAPPPRKTPPVQHRQRKSNQHIKSERAAASRDQDTASYQSTDANSTVSRIYSEHDFLKSFRTMTSVSSGAIGDGSTRSLISDLSADLLSLDLGTKGKKMGAAAPFFMNKKR